MDVAGKVLLNVIIEQPVRTGQMYCGCPRTSLGSTEQHHTSASKESHLQQLQIGRYIPAGTLDTLFSCRHRPGYQHPGASAGRNRRRRRRQLRVAWACGILLHPINRDPSTLLLVAVRDRRWNNSSGLGLGHYRVRSDSNWPLL